MKTRVFLLIALLAIMSIPASTAAIAQDEEEWDWYDVDHTELDFRAMDYLWESWGWDFAGTKVAVMPLTDTSDSSLLTGDMGGGGVSVSRRLAESLGYEFTRLGFLPIPYDDCYGVFAEFVDGAGSDSTSSSAQLNNEAHLKNKSDFMLDTINEFAPGALGWGKHGSGEGVYLNADDIITMGELLDADIIVRGSIKEYGIQRKVDNDLRTFIPPFLGLINKDKEGMIEATVYMYDASTGELIWAVYEYVIVDPAFPLFHTDFDIMDSAERKIARRIVSHLLMKPEPFEEEMEEPIYLEDVKPPMPRGDRESRFSE